LGIWHHFPILRNLNLLTKEDICEKNQKRKRKRKTKALISWGRGISSMGS
jgi:hypothetical protein